MDKDKLLKLYMKERDYQNETFGAFEKSDALNVASFLQFIEKYLQKAKSSYVGDWENDMPEWLESCREGECQDSKPVNTYRYLVMIFALSGAALEACVEINPEIWRKENDSHGKN